MERFQCVQQMREQQRQNAKAEAMLDANLDALGVDITNSGDMAEKLDVLKEAYEREWRAEKKRLKEERQQMLDEITLENKTLKAENRDLARQVANEQRRADRAEYSQIVQEREIMEWEAENNVAKVDLDACKNCGMCEKECPTGAIVNYRKKKKPARKAAEAKPAAAEAKSAQA